MSDLIDRQAAIDAIEQMQMPIMRSEFPEEQFVFTGMSEALQAIKDLPSAQPDRGYIEQIRWERDIAIQQLKDLGYGFGEKPRTDGDTISRQAAIEELERGIWGKEYDKVLAKTMLESLPSAQPDRGLIEQIRWERDTAIQQLKDLGYGFGEKPKTDDTISRQAAIDALDSFILDETTDVHGDTVREILERLPTIEERKTGRWIRLDKDNMYFVPHMLKCSVCGNILDKHGCNAGRGDANYCPNCGAKMEVEHETD